MGSADPAPNALTRGLALTNQAALRHPWRPTCFRLRSTAPSLRVASLGVPFYKE